MGFGWDSNLNIQFEANWNFIRKRKQAIINKNNKQENKKQKLHTYHINDKVLIKERDDSKFGANPYIEPVIITNINNNGTIQYSTGSISDVINVRNIHPYQE